MLTLWLTRQLFGLAGFFFSATTVSTAWLAWRGNSVPQLRAEPSLAGQWLPLMRGRGMGLWTDDDAWWHLCCITRWRGRLLTTGCPPFLRPDDDRPFIVLTETKPSKRHIPVFGLCTLLIYIYIYSYVYIYISIQMYMHVYIYIYIYIHTYTELNPKL